MSDEEPNLNTAYALETPEDNRRLYAEWADSYETGFAKDMDYLLAGKIALIFQEVGGTATPVLDVGAGTGLVVEGMVIPHGIEIDALDISAEMLGVAARRNVYRRLLQCDLTKALPIEDATYGGIMSAGTFTHGHVGTNALDELLRITKPDAAFVLSINAEHYVSQGFETKFAELEPYICDLEMRTIDIYGDAADADHRDDKARVAVFRKR